MREWRCCDAIFRVWEPLYRKWDMQTILTQPRALSPILQWLSSFLPGSTNYFKTAAQMDRENVSPCLLARSVWRCPWWWHHSDDDHDEIMTMMITQMMTNDDSDYHRSLTWWCHHSDDDHDDSDDHKWPESTLWSQHCHLCSELRWEPS